MDPKANLAEQLKLARRIIVTADGTLDWAIPVHKPEDVERLAELVIALDEWMQNGGFSPWPREKSA